MEFKSFWVVWCAENGPPHVRHVSKGEAVREAKRLAAIKPGYEFIVLEAIGAAHKTDVAWIEAGSANLPF